MGNSDALIVDPRGNSLVSRQSDVVDLTERGAIVLSHFHIMAQKLGWSIRCEKCGKPIQGYNSGHETHLSVRCGCTEFRAEISAGGRQRLG